MTEYTFEEHPELVYGLKVKGYANELGQEATFKISDCVTAIAYYLSAKKSDKGFRAVASAFGKELHKFSLKVKALEVEAIAKEKAASEAERENPESEINSKAWEYWLEEATIRQNARQRVRTQEFTIRHKKLKEGLIKDLEEGYDEDELEKRMSSEADREVGFERTRRLNREVVRRIEQGHGLDTVIENATEYITKLHDKVDEDPHTPYETAMPAIEGAEAGGVV